MKAGWKFLLFLYNLIFIAVGGCLVLVGVKNYTSSDLVAYYVGSTQQRVALCVIGVAIIFFAMVAIIMSLSSHGPKRIETVTLIGAQGGQVSISVDAIKTMISKAVNQIPSVREIKTDVFNGTGGIKVKVTLAIVGNGQFVNLSDQVQSTVQDYLSQTAGLRVEEVVILINESNAPVKVTPPIAAEAASMKLKQED